MVSPSPTRNWKPSGYHSLNRPFPPAPHPGGRRGATGPSAGVPSVPHPPPRGPPPRAPNPFPPSQSRPGDRKRAGLGRGFRGIDEFVCHGGGRRKGRGEPASEGERARGERGGRAGGGSSYLGRARTLAARSPGPRVTCGGRQVRTHWPPQPSARRARPQAPAPSGGSARPPRSGLGPAGPRGAPRSHSPAPKLRPPAQVTPPGARGGGGPGSPWWQRAPSARASPAAGAAAPAESCPPKPPTPARSSPGPRVPSARRCLWRSPPPWIMHRNFRKWIFYVFLCFGVLYVKLG